jgi:hypothetical protein
MKPGQLQQLQDLSKCYGLPRSDANFVEAWQFFVTEDDCMAKREKRILHSLTHQYRNQIKIIKKNQAKHGT